MHLNFDVSIGNIIAFFSLIGSIVTLILNIVNKSKTKDFAQNANAYNESAKKYYDLAVEQMKDGMSSTHRAQCDANIVKIGDGQWILKIYNKGTANASNVKFKYLTDDAPPIIAPSGDSSPIKLLEPQKNVDYHLIMHLGLKSLSWEYEISWTNENGKADTKKGILTLPLS